MLILIQYTHISKALLIDGWRLDNMYIESFLNHLNFNSTSFFFMSKFCAITWLKEKILLLQINEIYRMACFKSQIF